MVVILMGSPSDRPFVEKIGAALDRFGLAWEVRVASAHKTPRYLLDLLDTYEADGKPKVYITVAGRSNALSGMVDAHVTSPVIACPPYSDRFAGADLFSSLRMPSGVAPAVVLEPEGAALLAAKILACHNEENKDENEDESEALRERVRDYQAAQAERVLQADRDRR